ncbi:MAG: dihydrolipoyl dehydrogenase [Chlamydiia bacterium]|nr:dihydrolipoyl dehydrogenase [Chlamydiia bacterium]
MKTFDVIVIGSGPGGYVAALRLAQLGKRVACVEQSSTLGGTCLNVGCIPSKALLHSSHLAQIWREEGALHGFKTENSTVDFHQLQKRKAEVVKNLVAGVSGLFSRHGITRIEGKGKLISSRAVVVNEKQYTADAIILATGSTPQMLPFLPLVEGKIVDSTGALSLKNIPNRLLVVGAGVIGLELASVYARLGSKIVVLEMLDQICPGIDHSAAGALSKSLTGLGMQFHLGVKVTSGGVIEGKDEVFLKYEEEGREHSVEGDVILVAVGRRPYSEGLGLEEIGIAVDRAGRVLVDGQFETCVPDIYAIGDLIDGPMLAHKASEEGVVVAEIIAGHKSSLEYITIPNIIYTSPEVASVGLSENQAKEKGLSVLIGSYPFKANPRALCTLETEGMVKVIADAKSRRLLGMHIVASHASEMISLATLALKKRVTIEELAELPQAHPTLSEAIKEACLQALGRAIHA